MPTLTAITRLAAMALAVVAFTACSGDYIQVSAGADHTCALRSDGSVVCWGDDEWGQLRVPEEQRFTSIAAGNIHTCGLREDGTTACWGYGLGGGLPEESRTNFVPVFPPEDERFTSISATHGSTCGLREDGTVACWQLRPDGIGEYAPFESEQMVGISGSAAGLEICGLKADGSGLCVHIKEANVPTTDLRTTVTPAGEKFVSLSVGFLSSCGLRSDASALCWGFDTAGQFPPDGEGPFSDLALGYFYTCGLRPDGSVECWGHDWEQYIEPRLNSDSTARDWTAEQVLDRTLGIGWVLEAPRTDPPQDERFTSISGGTWHACGVREDGGISCWGYNRWGQGSPPSE